MKPLTSEWVAKAEGDWHSLQREARARRNPNYDAACFHAQQCAEKYLKACLQEAGVPFGKTHNLLALLTQCVDTGLPWAQLADDLRFLNTFAIDVRYPGAAATVGEARTSLKIMRRLRVHLRAALGLLPGP